MVPPKVKKSCKIKIPSEIVVTDPAKLRWGTVSTILAPLVDIARFAAFHLDLGASRVTIYLDKPSKKTVEFFAPFEMVEIIQCDRKYWSRKRRKARLTHQLRQTFNATLTYKTTDLDWLCHIDVDEFLLTEISISQILADAPVDAAYMQMSPAELLAQKNPWSGPSHFKLVPADADQPRSVVHEIYPQFGGILKDGFISHTSGKYFARTGLPDMRIGIHAMRHEGLFIRNCEKFDTIRVGHAHAPTWNTFEKHIDFRVSKGSYRKKKTGVIKLQDIIEQIIASEGMVGLRRFYDDICLATPELLDRLKTHKMLLTARLDLDEKVALWFGDLPPKTGRNRA